MTRRTWLFLAAALLMVSVLGSIAGAANAALLTSAPSTSANAGVAQKESGKIDALINCADIERLGIDKQTNLRASEAMVRCGKAQGGNPASGAADSAASIAKKILGPLVYGGADVCVSCPETTAYPKITQSEAFVWAAPGGNPVVTTINDSRASPGCYAGGAYSTDGGATFSRIGGTGPSPFCTGHGTNYGDPTVVYSVALSKWFASFLSTGCGGQGVGIWESTDGINWTTGVCAHNGTSDDRQSHWIDNNPASPYYGRQYISWNDFGQSQQIRVTWSDNGTTWSTPVNVTTSFIRNVQLTGDLGGSGRVYIASMNEGGGGLNGPRQNIMQRSTDGGATWTSTTMGPTFLGPGRGAAGYFATMYASYWRHMGWGQPAANGNFVHYVYSERPTTGGDPGNMMYTRSTDTGTTWSTPIQLNTDTTTRLQWQGNLAANTTGALFTGWYDERETTTCGAPGANTPCYRRWGRASTDSGATWLADDMVGDVISPLPAQPDTAVQAAYAGDYDYSSAQGSNFYQEWTDGRNLISGNSQQDVFFDKIPVIQGTPTPTATGTLPTATATRTRTTTPTVTPTACGGAANYTYAATSGATIVPGTTNTGSACDDCVTTVTLPFPFQLYDQIFTTVDLDSNGKAHFPTGTSVFTNSCLPTTDTYTIYPYWDDLRTDASGSGIFTSVSGVAPNRIFNIEWRTTYFSGGAPANFELRLYESTATNRFDVIYGTNSGNTSATGGVQRNNTQFTQAFCNGAGQSTTSGTMLAYTRPGCGTPPTQGPTSTATATVSGGSVTATATCVSGGGPIVVNGALTASDPTLATRLFRDDPASTCAAPQPYAGTTGTGPFYYDTYTYPNNTGASTCVTILVDPQTCTGTPFIHAAAYLNTFDPNNLATNYLGDIGASPTGPTPFEVTVPAGQSVVVLITSVTAGSAGECPGYQLTISGLGGGGCATATAGTAVPTTAVPTATCVAGAGSWTTGPNHPASPGIVRAVGVYFPANGKFYTIGGRTSDSAGSDTTNPYEFTPGSPGTWATKAAVLPDNEVNNMACGVLTDAGTPYIYCVGGSAAGATTATARVFRYNPVTDAVSAVVAPWPGNAGGDTLPGGFAVVNNKLYIIGGFQINVAMTNQTWEFTPGANTWTARANYPVARGYVPAAAIGTNIFTGGGSDYQGGLVVDTADSFKFDTVANTWTPITNIPRATGETRAVTMNGTMWVLGGGRDAPNPNNQVDIYNPTTNSWSLGQPFPTAARNFPADSNGTTTVWRAGGYAPSTPTNVTEIFQGGGGGCPTSTVGPTNTVGATSTRTSTSIATSTRTSTAVGTTAVPTTAVPTTAVPTGTRTGTAVVSVTPTVTCNIEFSDVPTSNTFRIYILCLACRGIVSGYSDGTFRPFNDVTRGQAAKMISNSAGFSENYTTVRYTDVPVNHTFYQFIMRLTTRNIATGYNDPVNCAGVGTPCFRPQASITRGQLAKIASNGAGFNEPIPAGSQAFTDVPPSHTFYVYIQRLSRRGIISGYDCGVDPGEPCDPQGRPYYRPQNNVTRGQTAKIVANTFFPECQQPGPQTTPPASIQSEPANQ